MQFWEPGRNFCCHKPKKLLFQVRIKGKLTKLSKISFIRSMILWRLRVQFSILISLPKTFSPSTVNVRSKIRRVWKKRDLKKKFYSKCSFGQLECSFKKKVEIFPPFFEKSFSSVYFTSTTNISKRTHIDTYNAFLTTRVKTLLPQFLKIYVPSPKKMKTYKTFKKKFFSPKWYSEDLEYNLQFWYSCPKLFRQSR